MIGIAKEEKLPKRVKEFLKGLEKINELRMTTDAIVQERGLMSILRGT
ncbi:MAG: hypothetical protein QXI35_08810 [Candidatus Nezhaarchaeales archaeon]